MTDEILSLNSNNELVAKDPSTGNTRPVTFAELEIPEANIGDTASSNRTLSINPNGELLTEDSDNSGVLSKAFANTYDDATIISSSTNSSANQVLLGDASSGGIDITLPVPESGVLVTVKKIDSTSNPVDIVTPNNETIDGASSITIKNQFAAREVISDGSNYFII